MSLQFFDAFTAIIILLNMFIQIRSVIHLYLFFIYCLIPNGREREILKAFIFIFILLKRISFESEEQNILVTLNCWYIQQIAVSIILTLVLDLV